MIQSVIPTMPPMFDKLNWQYQAAFHQGQLKRVKNNLGKECTYISHVETGDKRFIKAIMLNESGGKDTVSIEIDSNLALFREKEYDDIQKTLGTRSYDRDREAI